MKIVQLLTQEDIKTRQVGSHYEIMVNENLTINFTPGAVDEFINDIRSIREFEKKKNSIGDE